MADEKVIPGTRSELEYQLFRQKVACEENTIREALRNLLGRPETMEDAKACGQIVSDPWDGSYVLTYKGIKIGIVKHIDTAEGNFRVEFHPFRLAN